MPQCAAVQPSRRFWSALAPLFCALVLLPAWLWPSAAEAQIVGRGREAEVQRLFAPFGDGLPITPAVRLTGIRIGHDEIVVQLAEAATGTSPRGGDLRLMPFGKRAAEPTAPAPSGSFQFAVRAPSVALGEAAGLLADAVRRNDDGQFFARGGKQAAPEAPPPPLWVVWTVAAMWGLVALAVAALALRHRQRLAAWLFAAVILVLAARARQDVLFTPLHADDHAWLDAAIGLANPDVAGAAHRLLGRYGPSWVLLQRWTAPLLGDDLEALGRWSTVVGALAAVLSGIAAARLTGLLRHGWLPALVVAWLPVSVRVGRSESAVVLAQLLLAAVVLLAPGRRWLEQLGCLAAIALLATGHPVGPVFAAAGVAAVWALRRPPNLTSANLPTGAGHFPALPGPAGTGPGLLRRVDWPTAVLPSLGWLCAAGWLLRQQQALLGERLDMTKQVLPIPGEPWAFWLWWRSDYGSAMVLGLSFVGPLLWTQVSRWRRLWLVLALLAGSVAGWLVVACLTDALRYQAPLAPLVAIGLATWGVAREGGVPRPFWQPLAMLGVVWQLIGQPAGLRLDDAQAQSFRHLQHIWSDANGEVQFLLPDQGEYANRRVVMDAPRGRLWAGGPRTTARSVVDFVQDCRDGVTQPPAWLYLSSTCAVVPAEGQGDICASLHAVIDHAHPVRSAIVKPLRPLGAFGLRGEFHDYRSDVVDFRLARAKCPD